MSAFNANSASNYLSLDIAGLAMPAASSIMGTIWYKLDGAATLGSNNTLFGLAATNDGLAPLIRGQHNTTPNAVVAVDAGTSTDGAVPANTWCMVAADYGGWSNTSLNRRISVDGGAVTSAAYTGASSAAMLSYLALFNRITGASFHAKGRLAYLAIDSGATAGQRDTMRTEALTLTPENFTRYPRVWALLDDAVAQVRSVPGLLTASYSGGATSIILPVGYSGVDDWYNGFTLNFLAGTGSGQAAATISDYVGSTRTATLSGGIASALDTTSLVEVRGTKNFTATGTVTYDSADNPAIGGGGGSAPVWVVGGMI
jgi:hypothetical protein